ncbi:MAG: hypothetical protein KGQ46_09090 [Hyphomicrobiales bacterium]|nr:hypothetical protein [Hyphomicrobiales bacterium]MDE2115334.1 hypothetical protein [Hyphomicrobiales bacterium]
MTKAKTMTDSELDGAYTDLCKTMTRLGEAQSALFLARFALLSMVRIDDAKEIQSLIAEAAAIFEKTDA